jgi:hypothetical protein
VFVGHSSDWGSLDGEGEGTEGLLCYLLAGGNSRVRFREKSTAQLLRYLGFEKNLHFLTEKKKTKNLPFSLYTC